jgi:hypothetical protein
LDYHNKLQKRDANARRRGSDNEYEVAEINPAVTGAHVQDQVGSDNPGGDINPGTIGTDDHDPFGSDN